MNVLGMSKTAVSAMLVAVLAMSLLPGSALAEGAQLQAGAAAVSAQSVKPKTPKAAPKSLYSLYKPVLKKAVSGTGVFAKNYAASDKNYWKPTYSVFDVGADGVPELLVRNGTFTFNSVEDVFTVKSGKVVHMGTYWDGAGGSAGNKKGQLYSAGWRAGASNVDLVTFKGGKAAQKTVATGRATASNPTGEFQAVSDYLKKHKATWLTSSSAGDYTLLKKKAKITSKKIYDASVSVQKSAAYTGKALKPKVSVMYLGKALKAGKDYSVIYKNAKGKKVSAPKAAGAYKVTVKGKGSYKGSRAATFTVKKRAPVTVKATGVRVTLPEYWRGKVEVSKSSYASRAYVTVRDKKGALVMQVQCAPKSSFSVDGQMGTQTVGTKSGAKYTAAVTWDSFGAMARYDSTVKLQSGGKVGSLAAATANRDAWIAKTNAYLKKAVLKKMKVG